MFFDMSETDVDALRLEKLSGEKVVGNVEWCPTGVGDQHNLPKLTSAWDWVEDHGGLPGPSFEFE